jgi:hypothetical protein
MKLADIIFIEEKVNKSEKFVRKVKSTLYPILLNQARFVISSMKNGKKPSDKDVLNQMNYYMRSYVGQNPLDSLDTYGVAMVLGYLIKDKKLSGKAKRYYKAVLDAWLKNRT